MAAIITNKLRIFNAQEFLQSINRSAASWTQSNSYSAGNSVVNNQNLFICISDHTSAASGTGPTPSELSDGGSVRWVHQGLSVYNNLYMAIGKNTAWLNDANPPTPEDSIGYGYSVKANQIAMKKVNGSDMTLAIPRINWKSGTVYTMYEHDTPEEIIPNSYVITEGNNQFNVYKCINNMLYTNDTDTIVQVPSTVKPTTTSTTNMETTSDGYIWKYMYSIALSKSLKFLTKDYIPIDTIMYDPNAGGSTAEDIQWAVQTAAGGPSATIGKIKHVKILPNETGGAVSGGIGYLPNILRSGFTFDGTTTISIPNIENTTNQAYKGYHLINTSSNPMQQFVITNWSVSGTTATATLNGTISAASAQSFIIAPGITISGNGTGFKAYGIVQNGGSSGKISSFKITDEGANWTNVDNATVSTEDLPALSGGNPNVNAVKVKPIISPEKGHGFDAVEEMGGYYIMIAMKLEYDEQSTRLNSAASPVSTTKVVFPVSGTQSVFRQIAILADPLEKTTLDPSTEESYRGPKHPDFGTADETTFDVETGSGKVLYTENRQPVSRAIDQIEDIKVVFEF